MKDFISKVTFGFLMAQLLPGAVVICAFTCVLPHGDENPDMNLDQLLACIDSCWFQSTAGIIAFLFTSVAVGMLIHGLNWTVLAWLERRYPDSRKSFWHQRLLVFQVITSPVKMVLELLWLLLAPDVDSLTTDENAPVIDSSRMPQFTFLQEFYLHFGQFYAHMAYAALVVTILSWTRWVGDWSGAYLLLGAVFYLLTSVFFLLGRVQLGSLFVAERRLVEPPSESAASPGHRDQVDVSVDEDHP